MKLINTIISVVAICVGLSATAENPKREFRGAWMHTVFQDGYLKRSTDENKQYLRDQLDRLKSAGVNAVIFQVRPQADAFYPSPLEPWSRFLTDNGKAPIPAWDPLQFMIDESHARGMELHAWLNPYRVTSSKNQTLPQGHVYHKHPEWFVRFDGKIYFDPGLHESRDFITAVVRDIVTRYDVDGIHFDDYFYPYPVKGLKFQDAKSYSKYGKGMELAEWRRKNVDKLIEQVHAVIAATKPWVVFGISPFGIWRNKTSDPTGSDTRGLQNYDDLYADVLLWAREGWIDYQLPQLYWELENKSAPYLSLIDWWAANSHGRHMFIGQDVNRTMTADELTRKVDLTRRAETITGNCWWPAYSVTSNVGGIADSLACNYQSTVALVPDYPWISDKAPKSVSGLRVSAGKLQWRAPEPKGESDDAVKYVIYRFDEGEKIDLTKSTSVVAVTWNKSWKVSRPGIYIVTALSRVNRESAPSEPIKVKL
ncbi:MAG: family 10 glycosylhydrolase [Bacteroidales bacterium]|nr:family 10 glycosylhydrolase [Bacteroidales bacterium]